GGATVPFIARYRKDQTGKLDEVALRNIQEESGKAKALEERKAQILASLEERGLLVSELRTSIEQAPTRAALEDLYAPYKTARKTRASQAIERGLLPLADRLLDPREAGAPEVLAGPFVSAEKGVGSVAEALEGASDIIREKIATDAVAREKVRDAFWERGKVVVAAARGKKPEVEKSKFRELVGLEREARRLPGHRVLAVNRGEREGLLSVSVACAEGDLGRWLEGRFGLRTRRAASALVSEALGSAYKERLAPSAESHVRARITELAEDGAIEAFTRNLRALLLAPPLKGKRVLGFDPGFANGCKLACVDATGKMLAWATIFPHPPRAKEAEAKGGLEKLVRANAVELVAIGNGTGARESVRFVRQVLGKTVEVAVVSEAGASVYSASEVARDELPDLDVTIRGAVSIARRVQDPLAELVKVEPRSLGVGQYQHDVDQKRLETALDAVVEDAVALVGVDANTASAPLLRRVPGVGPVLAKAIVAERESGGPFATREDLRRVRGLGPKTFEQVAGFLRVRGREPLDATAVHPESYELARRILRELGLEPGAKPDLGVDPARFIGPGAGIETVRDILGELARPGRDPRGEAKSFEYQEGVENLDDLQVGMQLPGTVTNVTDFGAFVDIGVHRDGLVHVSQLAERRVEHPADVVSVGDHVRVRVVEIDRERGRIALSMRSASTGESSRGSRPAGPPSA
ncbi:MAG TPA: Tex family protein, partial [Planctomycetota bacterium]|nr:Tex family protein [Planctomycetota bacterium]